MSIINVFILMKPIILCVENQWWMNIIQFKIIFLLKTIEGLLTPIRLWHSQKKLKMFHDIDKEHELVVTRASGMWENVAGGQKVGWRRCVQSCFCLSAQGAFATTSKKEVNEPPSLDSVEHFEWHLS